MFAHFHHGFSYHDSCCSLMSLMSVFYETNFLQKLLLLLFFMCLKKKDTQQENARTFCVCVLGGGEKISAADHFFFGV
jgi:hypothetical protein